MTKAILTDIEGTTTSIAFVKDTLFPYARARIGAFVRAHADRPDVAPHVAEVHGDPSTAVDIDAVARRLEQWIDQDQKATPLKALQGIMWRAGYESGDFHGHLYPDAVEGLRRWHASGLKLYVYSSGSVQAQQLLFRYSVAGDLTPIFSGYFDTRVGPKKETASYAAIVAQIGEAPSDILFLSDVAAELDAARAAGVRTTRLVRPADGTEAGSDHPEVADFTTIA